jgi:hypothetical protein
VQLVREAEQPVVLARVLEVEDVLRQDADLADAGAGRLELGQRGYAFLGFACLGERRQANGQPKPSVRGKPDRGW